MGAEPAALREAAASTSACTLSSPAGRWASPCWTGCSPG